MPTITLDIPEDADSTQIELAVASALKAAGERNYSARAGETIVGRLARGNDGQFTSTGEGGGESTDQVKPTAEDAASLTALSEGKEISKAQADALIKKGLLKRDKDGKLTFTEAGRAAMKPPKGKGGGGGGDNPDDNSIEAQAKRYHEVMDSIGGMDEEQKNALLRLSIGNQIAPKLAEEMSKLGLVVTGADGKFSLSAIGKEIAEAAKKGDAKAAKEAFDKLSRKSVKSGARNSGSDLALGRTAKTKLKEALEALESMGIFDEETESKSFPVLFNYVKHLHLSEDEEYLRDVIAVKSVARDTILGYSMLWGDAESVDLENEFFTKSTDFWDKILGDNQTHRPLTWEHGQEPQTKASPIVGQIVEFGDDDVGRWYVAQLDRAHQYRKAIDALISKREVGTSSDSAPQYVVRERAGKAVWLKQWPWFASALTTTPAEPRMFDAGSLYWKSLGIDTARMGASDDAKVEIPDELRREAQLIKYKVGTL